MLVRIVKSWDEPNLLRQCRGAHGLWGDVRFTLAPVEECDFLIVLNEVREKLVVRCPAENVWALMQEPFVPGVFDWMEEGHRPFSRVFTHHVPVRTVKYVTSPPLVPWHVDRNFDFLSVMEAPVKHRGVSWITSSARIFPGHRRRMDFLDFLVGEAGIDVDMFGRGIRPIADKWDGLAPYRYSIAVENSFGPDYWTEKLADCFLTYTLPFYYGCPNLERYFPSESFIRIDITDPDGALNIMQRAVANDEYSKRLPAIAEARRRVLLQYQFFPFMAEQVVAAGRDGKAKDRVVLKPYRRSLRRRLLNLLLSGGE
ncbi:glycosyltransferase family 10 domain-containing protein [Trichloromonas sp.]|uniref:glycosyltransferase family 10 domain-containing protein n=1 Tax=Trichloromonas sp. TaxID=3069249 RepID=UPI003D816461